MRYQNSGCRRLTLSCLLLTAAAFLSCGGMSHFAPPGTPAAAQLTLSAATLNFGNVSVGQHKSSTLTLTNSAPAGSASGTVTGISTTGTGFSVSAPGVPFALGPGESASLTVSFQPNAAKSANGQLSITIEGAAQADVASLSATGIAASGQLGVNPSALSFGTVTVGNSQSQNVSLSATAADIVISGATTTGPGFSLSGISFPATIPAGSSAGFSIKFAPNSSGPATGQVAFSSNASNSATLSLTGTGSQQSANITVTPASLNFGNVPVGNRKSSTVTVTNSAAAGSAAGIVTQISATGASFSVSAPAVPFTLDPGQSASLTVSFAPNSAAADSGQVAVAVQGTSQPDIVDLSGTGVTVVGQISVSPSTMNLGTVTLGSSQTQRGTLSASGADVTVSSGTVSGQAFSLSGISFPATITAGTSIPFTITFTPQSAGTATGQVSFSSDASNSPSLVSLTGTGSQPSQQTVTLNWNASSQVIGYNVYRGVQSSGPFTKVNASLISVLSYTDATVQSGTTYYYVVTAVNSNHVESTYSNVATAVVP